MDNKYRKTINVSLQSKKYYKPMNELIHEWEEDGCNLSVQICEQLLKLNKLEKFAAFLNVFAIFELTEKMANVYNIDDKKMDEILSKVIKIDNVGLSEIFMTLSQIQDTPIVETKKNIDVQEVNIEKPIQEISLKPVEKIESIPTIIKTETVIPTIIESEEQNEDFDMEIPMDFLLNG